jgi:uncharacterized protein YciI
VAENIFLTQSANAQIASHNSTSLIAVRLPSSAEPSSLAEADPLMAHGHIVTKMICRDI